MGLMIRKATEKDFIQIFELCIQVGLTEDYKSSSDNWQALLTKTTLYPRYTFFVVEEDSTIIATFSLLIMDNLAHEGANSGLIDSIAIESASNLALVRNRIIDFALKQYKEEGCYKLALASKQEEKINNFKTDESIDLKQHGFCFVAGLKKEPGEYLLKPFFVRGVSELAIHEATEADLPSILTLYAQPEMDDEKILTVSNAIKIFKKMRMYPNYKIFIAKLDNETVGSFALLVMDNLIYNGKPTGIIEDVAVSPKSHGKGIGKTMMNFAMEQCIKADCYKLILSSSLKRVIAHNLYKSFGFEQTGISFLISQESQIEKQLKKTI